MDALDHIERFIQDVNAAGNLEDILACLRRQIERLGFERFTYELMWPDGGARKPLFITSYPADWINRYIEKKYESDDLTCRNAGQMMRPFAWPEVKSNFHMTAPQRLVFNEAAELGLKSGGTVPIHGPGAAKAYVAVANSMADDEFTKLFLARRHELHLLATYAHEKIMALGIDNAPSTMMKLTAREIEVMTWTARGKTRWEISEILSISEETVKAHTENACRKLNASNKTHATAVALVSGLIAP